MSGWQEKYLNRIVQGDCLELMRELPDKRVDAELAQTRLEL